MKQTVGLADVRDVNTTEFGGNELSLNLLTATCDTVPFLAEKRLVIVSGLLSLFERRAPSRARAPRSADQKPSLGQWQGLPQYLSRVPSSTALVFVEGRLSESNPLFAAVRPHVEARMFPLPNPNELRRWIRDRAKAMAVDIEPRAIDTLADTVGSDLGTIAVELQKLSLYCWGRAIRHEDVLELVSYTKDANIFAAVDAMMESRPEAAITLVHNLLQSGSPPGHILSMMARQVRLLILAKDTKGRGVPAAEQAKRLGLTGYPLRKTLDQERRFSAQRLVDIHRKLLETDVSMKTSRVGEELLLDLLIAEVSAKAAGGAVSPSARFRR